MKYVIFSIAIFVTSSCTFAGNDMLGNDKVLEAHKAVELCVKEYSRLSNKIVAEDIDRVYVLVSNEKMDLLFAHGEVGTFGNRSEKFKSFFSCGVLNTENPKLYFLGEPLKDPLVSNPDVLQITESGYAETLWDLLFLKKGSEFEFVESKVFSTDDIEPLKGSTLD
jgi:hypothetical protein